MLHLTVKTALIPLLLGTMLFFLLLRNFTPQRKPQLRETNSAYKGRTTQNSDRTTISEMRDRMKRIESICKHTRNVTEFHGSNGTKFTFEGTNVCMCKVAKAGSTFWLRALLILMNPESVSEYSSASGVNLHDIRVKLQQTECFPGKNPQQVSFFISRDPYDRLYSTYIDKIYLPKFWKVAVGLSLAISHAGDSNFHLSAALKNEVNAGRCISDITFKQFFFYVNYQYKRRLIIDHHTAPVSTLCNPCKGKYDFLIRHENFRQESKLLLEYLGIGDVKKLTSQLEEESVYTSVRNLLETFVFSVRNQISKGCKSSKILSDRLWNVLKLKGYISEHLPIPPFLAMADIASLDVSETLEYLKHFFQSNEQQELQRRENMKKAYRDIPAGTVKMIQTMFEMDFELFEYNKTPPKA